MPANVIFAAPATGESIRLAVCEAIEQRAGLRRATVLFGSQGEADAIRRFWATERPDLSMGVESSTLSAFVDGRWALFGDGTSVATPGEIRVAAMSAMRRYPSCGLRPSSGTVEMITRIARSGFGAPGFESNLQLAGRGAGALVDAGISGTEAEVWMVLAAMEDVLCEMGATPYGRALASLAELLCDQPPEIMVMQRDPLPVEMEYATIRGCTVILPGGKNHVALSSARSVSAVFEERGATVEERCYDSTADDARSQELADLDRLLFVGGDRVEPTGAVRFALSSGHYSEAPLIAGEVLRCIESGADPSNIFIVSDGIDRSDDLIERLVLSGVAVTGFSSDKLAYTSMGRAFIQATTGSTDPVALADLALSGLSGVSRHMASILDASWRGRPGLAKDDWLSDIGSCSDIAKDLSRAIAESDLRGVLSSLLRGHFRIFPDGGESASVGARMNVAAHERISDLLESMDTRGITLADVLEIMKSESVRVRFETSSGANGQRAVRMGSLEQAAESTCDILVLAGLTADRFPVDSGELPGDSILQNSGIVRISSNMESRRLALYRAIRSARSMVIVERKMFGADGEEMRPSALFEEIADCYCEDPSDLEAYDKSTLLPRELMGEVSAWDGRPIVVELGEGDLSTIARMPAAGLPRPAVIGRVVPKGPEDLDHSERMALVDCVSRASGGDRIYSPTFVEAYMSCPYRWFVEKMLRPEPLDVTFDNRMAGTLVHELLYRYYMHISEGERAPRRVTTGDLEDMGEILDSLASEYVGEMERNPSSPFCAMTPTQRMKIGTWTRWARRVLEADMSISTEFVPSRFELSFGLGDKSSDDSCSTGEGPFEYAGRVFRGKIDRLDVDSHGRAVIHDYKSSIDERGFVAPEQETTEVGSRWRPDKVQALIYASAAQSRLGLEVAGVVYRSYRKVESMEGVCDGTVIGPESFLCSKGMVGLSHDGFAGLLSDTEACVAEALDAMEAGEFPRSPHSANSCRYCPVAASCGSVIA